MLSWTKWPKWLKVILTIPTVLYALYIILYAGIIFLFTVPFKAFHVVGSSMSPTYNNGVYIAGTSTYSNKTVLERGDVVVFRLPDDSTKQSIKRIIALPGDTVSISSGNIYINGKRLDEHSYLSTNTYTNRDPSLMDDKTETVPEKKYFVLGDNRNSSTDSRTFGFVPVENIVSKISFCYWGCIKK